MFDTVPEPTMLPAPSSRVFAAWATSWAKLKVMSSPAFGLPNGLSLRSTSSGKCSLLSAQSAPSSSGVTATGENALAAFDWKKPKPLASSPGIRLRKETSLTSMTRRIAFAASSTLAPMATSPVITATSASRSMPHSSDRAKIGSRGPMKLSEPPWYISGSV
ncbi:hypothetical protein D3C85_333240 [compost metagenome]